MKYKARQVFEDKTKHVKSVPLTLTLKSLIHPA